TRLGQGRENAKAFLRENPSLCREIENLIRRKAGLEALPEATAMDVR
ncbi:MAG: recombinase RecA, partial [Anaerolineae bacterium]